MYVDNNLNDYPKKDGNTYCISFDELIKSKHLEKGIIDATGINYLEKTVRVTASDLFNYEIVNKNECTEIKNEL